MAGDYNFYRYVGNDPMNYIDPYGLAKGKKDPYAHTLKNKRVKGNIKIKPKDLMKKPNIPAILQETSKMYFQSQIESWVIDKIEKAGGHVLEPEHIGPGSDYYECQQKEKRKEKEKTQGGLKVTKNSKAEQLKKNREQGKKFEKERTKEFKKENHETENEITLKTESGTKTRVDVIGKDKKTGILRIEEHKSSATAPLTKNQTKAFPELEKSGGVVVGKGKGAYPGGTKIPPTKVKIVRPE